MHMMSFQGHPTRHIDISSKTNEILSMQSKAIHLLSTYTFNVLLEAWIRKYGRKFTYIVKSRMNPNRGTRSGDDAPDKAERGKKCNKIFK